MLTKSQADEAWLRSKYTAGEVVLVHFVKAHGNNAPQSEEDIAFLAEAFQKILDGENPKKALRLEKKQGRKSGGRQLRLEQSLAWEVAENYITKKSRSHADAIRKVSSKHNIPFDTLKRYWGKWGKPAIIMATDALPENIRKWQSIYKELLSTFGNVDNWSCPYAEEIYNLLLNAPPSEYNKLVAQIKSITDTKSAKT